MGITDGSGTRALAYAASGLMASETYADGLLKGLSLKHGYDSLLRRDGLVLKNGGSTLYQVSYGYGSASRLASVTSGDESVEYGYLTNSPLVETVISKRNGSTVLTTTKAYDYQNRLTATQSVAGGTAVSEYAYAYSMRYLPQKGFLNWSWRGFFVAGREARWFLDIGCRILNALDSRNHFLFTVFGRFNLKKYQ